MEEREGWEGREGKEGKGGRGDGRLERGGLDLHLRCEAVVATAVTATIARPGRSACSGGQSRLRVRPVLPPPLSHSRLPRPTHSRSDHLRLRSTRPQRTRCQSRRAGHIGCAAHAMSQVISPLLLLLSCCLLPLLCPVVSAAGVVDVGVRQLRGRPPHPPPQLSERSNGFVSNTRAPPPPPPSSPPPPFHPLSHPLEALRGLPYPTPPLPPTVFRYSTDGYTADDAFLLLTLGGAAARHNALSPSSSDLWPLLYATTGTARSSPAFVYWDAYAQRLPQVHFSTDFDAAPASSLLTLYARRGYIVGAYLTALHTDSVDVCVSMVGITEGTICATSAHSELLQQLGVPILRDLRAINETLFLDQFLAPNASAPWPFSTRFVSSQQLDPALTALSDWSILIGAVQLHHTDSYRRVMAYLQHYYPTPHFNGVFGWYPDGSGEFELTGTASANDAGVMASDWLRNGAVHASMVRAFTDIRCPSRSTDPVALARIDNRRRHTLALLFTDGDNLQANENNLLDRTHWAHPQRGSIPIGWGLNPTLASTLPRRAHLVLRPGRASQRLVRGLQRAVRVSRCDVQ